MKKLSTENFIKKSKEIHGNKFEYSESIYNGYHEQITIICLKCSKNWSCQAGSHLRGNGCPHCRLDRLRTKKSLDDFIKKAKSIHGDKFDYSEAVYHSSRERIKNIKCNVCGMKLDVFPTSHYRGSGCPKCNYKKLKQNQPRTHEDFVDKAKIKHPDKYEYLGEYQHSRIEMEILCKKCDKIFLQKPVHHLLGHGCPVCGSNFSSGEDEIDKFLTRLKIKFERQKKFIGCKFKKQLKFDFYLPDQNLCIEFDGIHHYEKFPTRPDLLVIRLRDDRKNKFCEKNNIKLLRIPYWEQKNIPQILTKELGISNVDNDAGNIELCPPTN